MKFRLNSVLLLAIFCTALIVILFSLDNDVDNLLEAGIINKKPAIVVNQVGYLPQWQKIAFFRQNTIIDSATQEPQEAILIDRDTEQEVATIPIAPAIIDRDSKDAIASIDFSQVTQPGNYELQVDEFTSVPFKIGKDIYQEPLVKLLRSYYTQRCGVAIDDPISGISHPPCHVNDGIIAPRIEETEEIDGEESTIEPEEEAEAPTEEEIEAAIAEEQVKIDAVGGWHDGGSYNKYVATTTVTIGRLLSLYEQNSDLFPDRQLDIPESGNGKSDLLDEMEVGLNWLLKMQRDDGAVYRKLGGEKWVLDVSPDEDIQTRYVYGISTPETAKFAAVMAMASRNFAEIDREMADKYLAAANLAWQYLQNQPLMEVDWIESDDFGSDTYLASGLNTEASLTTDIDDRLWAAAELYITTGQNSFADYFADHLDIIKYTLFGWTNPAPLGAVNYWQQQRQPVSTELIDKIQTKIKERADLVLDQVNKSAYNIANERFTWGSNRMSAEEGITLIYAYKITNDPQYLNGAIDQLNYLLGRNHFNQTFITDIGTNFVNNLSNLYTRAKKIKLPGLVVSGANTKSQDRQVYTTKGHLSYTDNELSFATNGSATDYNASLISLIVNLIEASN